jgi:hypothetical protein
MAAKKPSKKSVALKPTQEVVVVKERHILELEESHGKARVLAVGLSTYPKTSGLQPLPVCSNDAATVRDRFSDIQQLHADPGFCIACTSSSAAPPTRGQILGLLLQLAQGAVAEDRLIFFYSGHGIRLKYNGADEFFLVPQDAYSCSDPDALIPFSRVKEILNSSLAKQKLVILDACFSGPDAKNLKALPPELSPKFMKEYLARTHGTAVLSSSGIEQTSTSQSPNPKLSLFTHYLCEALGGEKAALDNGRLTLTSLYDYLSVAVGKTSKSYNRSQHPALMSAVEGTMVLADFTVGILVPAGVELSEQSITELRFAERENGRVVDVLTQIKSWHYSQEYLEERVNSNLGEAYRDRFGVFAAKLTEEAGIPVGEVSIEDSGVSFPDGGYSLEYKASDKKTGFFRHSVWFGKAWFDQPEQMIGVLQCFELRPREMTLELSGKRSLDSMIAGLKARGWKLESNQLPKRFSASHDRYEVIVTQGWIKFSGFYPDEILGSESEPEKAALVSGILALLTNGS